MRGLVPMSWSFKSAYPSRHVFQSDLRICCGNWAFCSGFGWHGSPGRPLFGGVLPGQRL